MTMPSNESPLSPDEKTRLETRIDKTEENLLKVSSDISKLSTLVQTQAESLTRLEQIQEREHTETRREMTDGFSRIHDSIAKAREGSGPLLIGILSLVLVCVGGFATFVILTVQPIRARSLHTENRLESRLEQLPNDYYNFGKNTQMIESLRTEVDDLDLKVDLKAEDQAYTKGRIDALDRQVQSIDMYKSRGWNDLSREVPAR